MSYPALLSASLTSVANGVTATFDSERLQNTFESVLAIDEVRFVTLSPDVAAFNSVYDCGFNMRVKLDMDGLMLMRDYMPVGLCGPDYAPRAQMTTSLTVGAAVYAVSCYKWKFRTPLLVPVGGVLNSSMFRATDKVGGTSSHSIAYAGRVLPKNFAMPKKIRVPFVTGYLGTPSATSGISTEADLFNPCDSPLDVEFLIGRQFQDVANSGPVELLMDHVVKLSRSTGNGRDLDIVAQPTPGNHVFETNTRRWAINSQLPPRARYVYSFTYTGGVTGVLSAVSAVGDREEVIS